MAKKTKKILLNEGPDHGEFAKVDERKQGGFFTWKGNNYRLTQIGNGQFCGADRKPEDYELVQTKKS